MMIFKNIFSLTATQIKNSSISRYRFFSRVNSLGYQRTYKEKDEKLVSSINYTFKTLDSRCMKRTFQHLDTLVPVRQDTENNTFDRLFERDKMKTIFGVELEDHIVVKARGPAWLPNHKHVIVLNRSAFKYKKARDKFQMVTYKMEITFDLLTKKNLNDMVYNPYGTEVNTEKFLAACIANFGSMEGLVSSWILTEKGLTCKKEDVENFFLNVY